MNEERIQKVIEYATRLHSGQKRKDGKDYITHPLAVAEIIINKYLFHNEDYLEELIIIAVLHDGKEDCEDYTDEKFYDFLVGIGFNEIRSKIIVEAISVLSRMSKSDCVLGYLNGILGNERAKIVKLADLQHNMSDLAPGNLLDKYKLCKWYLEN